MRILGFVLFVCQHRTETANPDCVSAAQKLLTLAETLSDVRSEGHTLALVYGGTAEPKRTLLTIESS